MVQESADNHSGAIPGAGAPMSLPLHTRLGEFEIISVIGEGGFSIVYLAHDHQLERTVAIKEYLPGAIAYRAADGTVQPRFEKYESTFKTGLQSFLKEARILAQFEHHSLIRIHRFWEQNGTAYMVMQYCQGKTMRQLLQSDPARGTDEVWLKQVMTPVLDALRVLHARSCYHRDLSPDNIMILESGAPMLLDFGAARQVIGDMTQALTVILKPGFAPIEQYADDESMRQGPWTDIYGAGAVLYFAVTGKAPTASVARLVKDPLKKLSAQTTLSLSPQFAQAVDHALALFPADRPQSVDDFANELLAQDGPLSHFQVFPTLSGAAVTASAVAARQQAMLETQVEEEAQAQALTNAQVQAPPPPEPVQDYPATVMAPKVNELLQPAHEEWKTSTHAAPAPVVEPTPVEHSVRHSQRLPSAAEQAVAAPVPEPVVEKAMPAEVPVAPPRAPQPAPRPPVPTAKKPLAPAAPRVRVTEKSGGKKRTWGLYAGGGAAGLAALVAAAYFLGDSGQHTAIPPVAQGERNIEIPPAPPQPPSEPTLPPAQVAPEPAPLSPPAVVNDPAPVPAPPPPIIPPPIQPPAPAQPPIAVPPSPAPPASLPGRPNGTTQPGETNTGSPVPPIEPPNNKPVVVAPSNKPGAFVRFSIKPWGKVIVDGVEKGVSPPMVRMWLPEGEHSIVIENAGFPNFSTRLKVEDKKDSSLSYRFGG
ncbi:protein kinase [Diaphorobacter sp. HDW4A]|uniref:serine/threonine-protein kinase n=1 Tax=Diaphorobacter sp. HDW4A TaxID=2714924 RepID=UPI00140D896B|nr:serine/threonine-protein kinase [Diaphorobacter sp. HDW4A]QIL80306.1 protein kinase [Diaphorobacter sp. HDW4A]